MQLGTHLDGLCHLRMGDVGRSGCGWRRSRRRPYRPARSDGSSRCCERTRPGVESTSRPRLTALAVTDARPRRGPCGTPHALRLEHAAPPVPRDDEILVRSARGRSTGRIARSARHPTRGLHAQRPTSRRAARQSRGTPGSRVRGPARERRCHRRAASPGTDGARRRSGRRGARAGGEVARRQLRRLRRARLAQVGPDEPTLGGVRAQAAGFGDDRSQHGGSFAAWAVGGPGRCARSRRGSRYGIRALVVAGWTVNVCISVDGSAASLRLRRSASRGPDRKGTLVEGRVGSFVHVASPDRRGLEPVARRERSLIHRTSRC